MTTSPTPAAVSPPAKSLAVANPPAPLSQDIIREIAMDIGKAVAAHIETMYPKAVEATSATMLLSVRNCTFNEIMAALETTDEEEIRARLARRKQFRRQQRAVWKAIRGTHGEDQGS